MCECVCLCVCRSVLASVCVWERERECLFTSARPSFLWIGATVPHGAGANYIRAKLVNDVPPERERESETERTLVKNM